MSEYLDDILGSEELNTLNVETNDAEMRRIVDLANKQINLEQEVVSLEQQLKNKKEEFEGFNLINQKLISTLEKNNLKKMATKKGDDFDSEFHEAITSTPSEKKFKGKIVDIIEDGYLIGEKIIRFAKVVIGA